MRTYVAKGKEAEALKVGAQWFVVDATDQVLDKITLEQLLEYVARTSGTQQAMYYI